MTLLGAKVLDASGEIGEAGEQVARDAGFAIGAARYLMAVPQLVKAGRKPLSMESADALAAEGRERLTRARGSRSSLPGSVAPALLEASTAHHNLSSPKVRSAFRERLSILWHGLRGHW